VNLTKLINKKLNTKSNPQNETEAIQISMPFILKGAKRWCRNHFSYMDDFVMAGVEGALEAYKRFKGTEYEEKGYRYSSYSYMWIFAKQKEYAEKLWGYMNNTATIPDNWDGDEASSYEMNTDLLDVKKAFGQLSAQEQKLVQMKVEGHTFDEIAKQLGMKSLHHARNDYLKACKTLEQ